MFIFHTGSPLLSTVCYCVQSGVPCVHCALYSVHTTDHLHVSTVPAASYDISSCFCLIVCRGFLRFYCLDLHPFYTFIEHWPPIFMPMKQGLLLPDLKEKSSKFYTEPCCLWSFLCQYSLTEKRVIVPLKAIFWMVRFYTVLCHTVIATFPFSFSLSFCLTQGARLRRFLKCFFNPI
jgi:hypothetical protein